MLGRKSRDQVSAAIRRRRADASAIETAGTTFREVGTYFGLTKRLNRRFNKD